MKIARTGSYRPPRIEGADVAPDAGGAVTDSEGVDCTSSIRDSRREIVGSRVRETGETELSRGVWDSLRGLAANTAGLSVAENVESSHRGSGWSVNGGGRTTRGWPEASWGTKCGTCGDTDDLRRGREGSGGGSVMRGECVCGPPDTLAPPEGGLTESKDKGGKVRLKF